MQRGILLTEYRSDARPWTAADARRGANIVRVAALLRRLHALAANAPAYGAERIARQYLAALSAGVDARRALLDSRTQAWAEELLELAGHYDAAHPPSALCHNDLVAANVLDGDGQVVGGDSGGADGRLVLVDFEYAVRAAPVLDLAGLAGMNDYGERECRELLAAYYDGERAGVSLAQLTQIVRMVLLVAFFWARLGERGAANSAPYVRLADELEQRLK